ncbi:MAG: serine/threonine-protein kinase [Polyangiaceae bacterium]
MRERLAPGMIVGGRFQVESVIGRGDVGEVYRVKDPKTGLSYVLKLFTSPAMQDSGASAAFDRASRAAGQVAQEFVAIQELGMDPNGPFALLPAVSARSLDRYIEKKGPLSPAEMVDLVTCLAPPLDRAHASGLVHADLKPANVFFGSGLKGPVVRVTDFGVALLRMAAPSPWPCAYGWGAPEQVGGAPLMATMDVYGMALIAFYAMVGRPIFFALKLPTPEPQRLWEEMHTLPAASDRASELGGVISPVFDDIFRTALAPDPGHRYQSVTELAQELARAAKTSQTQMSAVPAATAPRGPVAPPPMVSGSASGPMHGTQVLTDDAVAKARAEIDALLAAKRAQADAGPASVPMPAIAPPPVAAGGVLAPPPVVSGGIAAPPMVSGGLAAPPMVPAAAPPPAVGDFAPPPMVPGAVAPPPVVPGGSSPDALGATNADAGAGNKRKVYGTMVADASEAFAMLESMGISQGGGAPPPVAPPVAPGPPPAVLPRGNTGGFGGGPVEPALVTGGSGMSMGSTRADAAPAAAPAPNPLGMSQLGMPLPEARRDATIVFTPPSGTNTKLIVIVVIVLLLVFGIGGALIAWLLSMDDPTPPPESFEHRPVPALASNLRHAPAAALHGDSGAPEACPPIARKSHRKGEG